MDIGFYGAQPGIGWNRGVKLIWLIHIYPYLSILFSQVGRKVELNSWDLMGPDLSWSLFMRLREINWDQVPSSPGNQHFIGSCGMMGSWCDNFLHQPVTEPTSSTCRPDMLNHWWFLGNPFIHLAKESTEFSSFPSPMWSFFQTMHLQDGRVFHISHKIWLAQVNTHMFCKKCHGFAMF